MRVLRFILQTCGWLALIFGAAVLVVFAVNGVVGADSTYKTPVIRAVSFIVGAVGVVALQWSWARRS